MAQKPHAVLVPFPAQGHVTPFMQVAKLLHARGFHITYVNSEYNHKRLVQTKGPDSVKGLPDFQFDSIPDGLPQSDRYDVTQDLVTLCDGVRKNCLAPFMELLSKLNSTPGVPPVSCIVSDGCCMTFPMIAAKQLGIPEAQFFTASACGFMGYLQYTELVKRGIIPLKDESDITNGYLEQPLDWIPGMEGVGNQLKDIPTFCRITDLNDVMFDCMISEYTNCLKSSALIMNTFDDLEGDVLKALALQCPNVYTLGPLKLLGHNMPESHLETLKSTSLWAENIECLDWLDTKKPASVVYVNFGSIAVLSESHLQELAYGLANCGYEFLWVLRNDVIMGESATLPEDYIKETKEKGLIINWCPQEKVLAHPSVGAFLTHVGWNSTLETISAGVPMLCWPVHGDQQMNTRFICDVWGNGLWVEPNREQIVSVVKEMMAGEKGKKVREKALEWKKKAEKATSKGGSSYENFNKLINDVLLKKMT